MSQKKLRFNSFDLFVPDLRLNLEGQPGVGTKVGASLSMVFLGVLGFLAYVIVSDFLDTRKPLVSQTVESTELPPFISFADDKLYPILIFRYFGSARLEKEQLARFVTVHMTKVEVRADESGSTTTSFSTMNVARCSELVAQGKLKSFHVTSKIERDMLLEEGVCVDPGDQDATLGRRTTSDPIFQQYMWRVFPCSLPTGCASREELSMLTFSSIIPKPNLDLSNKLEPVRYDTLMDEVTYLSTSLTARATINLMKTEIVDGAGFLQRERLVKSFTVVGSSSYGNSDRNPAQLTCTPAQLTFEAGCSPYWQQTILTQPRKMVIKRQYKGIVESFSELGGILDILFMLFSIPYGIYNSHILKQRLVEIVHGVKKPNRPANNATSDSLSSYKQQMESYKLLLLGVESCLDIIHLTKEVNRLRKIIQSNHLEHKDQDRGPEQTLQRLSLLPSAKGPKTRSTEQKLQFEVRDFEEEPPLLNGVVGNPQKSLHPHQLIPSTTNEVRISNAGKTRSIQLAQNSPNQNQLEFAAEIRQSHAALNSVHRRPEKLFGRGKTDDHTEGPLRKKESEAFVEEQRPQPVHNNW